MADETKQLRFLNGTDYLTANGWRRAEIGDVRSDVLPRDITWLVSAGCAEWVTEDDEPLPNIRKQLAEWGAKQEATDGKLS